MAAILSWPQCVKCIIITVGMTGYLVGAKPLPLLMMNYCYILMECSYIKIIFIDVGIPIIKVVRPSYLYKENSCNAKMISLYCNGTLVSKMWLNLWLFFFLFYSTCVLTCGVPRIEIFILKSRK